MEGDHVVDSGLGLADMRIEIDKLIESLKSSKKRARTGGAIEIGLRRRVQ
jgi:hypothetical protein